MNLIKTINVLLVLLIFSFTDVYAQTSTLDDFENTNGWNFIQSDGVKLNLSTDKGLSGNAIRFDYDFTKGTGYGGIQKLFPIDLPENYEFTFWVKAESPANNFEIKFIDKSGDNVWWVNNRNYTFPTEWKKITIKKRHISFAWGPTSDQDLKRIDRIEFTISSFVGGKGTLWIDDLKFEPLPPETQNYPAPQITASSSVKNREPGLMTDSSETSFWQSSKSKDQNILIDFKTRREFGGLQVNWLEGHASKTFDIYLSMDGKTWDKAYSVLSNQSNTSFIDLPEAEARYVRINFIENESNSLGIREIKFLTIQESMTKNDFLLYTEANSPKGDYPRYFGKQASYWTIMGVNNDVKEAMINEDGMVEVDKGCFSLEPMIQTGDSLLNWSTVKPIQTMGKPGYQKEFDFIPTVTWPGKNLKFETAVTASGEANKNSELDVRYSFTNTSNQPLDLKFYLLIRPYQVDPYYQFLNSAGGVGKIKSITQKDAQTLAVDDKIVRFEKKYDAFSAFDFDEGNPVDLIRQNKLPATVSATDKNSLANGVATYSVHLEAGQHQELYVVVPFYGKNMASPDESESTVADDFTQSIDFWKNKTGHIEFNLPSSADRIVNTYKSNLAYILVNRDKAGIQPGSRSYERSWIRDGALTSSALLKSGIVQEVKDFIDWYTGYQYENGKVPCVVDGRGPDPVPENDSHGELIYLIREYFNFTHDTVFLRSKNQYVLKAVDYLQSLIAERSTDHFKNGNDSVRAYYGLVPESISHEGYSAKPMHSYWDDFFTMKGLKDAADIQKILGEKESYEKIKQIRDTFRQNLYTSLDLAMKTRHIDFIPGCVELGDFDATSTTIALTPCNELNNLPKPQVYNTFDKYYAFFKNRRDGKTDWINYTPYENRLIGSFIILDEPERAHELIDFFLHDQRPQGWNEWAEVVWKDDRYPGYIGDMPHTWVGSDFINAIRSMFVYENEYDQSLDIASALYQDWIDAPQGMSVNHLPTYYGELSYSIKKENTAYHFSITGDLKIPAHGIKIRNFNGAKLPKMVTVNGKGITNFTDKVITINEFPAEVVIYY